MAWQNMQQPFMAPPTGGPNPVAAAVLGLIPGVGAMYNGQFFKGLIHVVIFAVLVNLADHYGIFGLFIAAWILYQSFEAYHTAVARRDGTPLPDPLGLNEVGNWLNLGRTQYPPQPQAGAPGPVASGPAGSGYQAPYTGPSYQTPYTTPYTPGAEYVDPAVPPVPPVPPVYWRRKEPIGAMILIGFGLILLLNQMGYVTERIVHYLWPLIFIALGVWLIVRRIGDSKGGAQ
jgi:TM2 domain-containing membrane protein YozV